MNHDTLHRLLSRRSKFLDAVGRICLRLYLYRENAYFHPDYNGEHRVLRTLKGAGFVPRTIFDIGANEGRWSAFAASIWCNARFHLFEPVPSIARRLDERFAGDERILVHNCAVGGEDGQVQFHENSQISSHSYVSRSGSGGNVVPLVSGSTIFQREGLQQVDLCKIDTEGFDLEVLHGFEPQLARKQIAFVQFEHHALGVSYGRTFAGTSTFLRDLGYRVGKIFPEGLREINYGTHDWSHQVGPNFLAASPQHSELFDRMLTR